MAIVATATMNIYNLEINMDNTKSYSKDTLLGIVKLDVLMFKLTRQGVYMDEAKNALERLLELKEEERLRGKGEETKILRFP
jgi:hypothetical protein